MLDPGNGFTKIVGYDNQYTVSTTIGGNYKIRGYISCPGEPIEFFGFGVCVSGIMPT